MAKGGNKKKYHFTGNKTHNNIIAMEQNKNCGQIAQHELQTKVKVKIMPYIKY